MANKTYYERGDTFVDASDKPAIIKKGNELTFTDDFKAGGGADLAPATAETLGGVKVGNGLNVASDGTLSVAGVDYSTTEHLTGRKWIDGKDIYEKTIKFTPTTTVGNVDIDASIDELVSFDGVYHDATNGTYLGINTYLTSSVILSCYISVSTGKIEYAIPSSIVNMEHIVTIRYTKPTVVEPTNNRTVKKTVKKG